jgi:hypothetical protein
LTAENKTRIIFAPGAGELETSINLDFVGEIKATTLRSPPFCENRLTSSSFPASG